MDRHYIIINICHNRIHNIKFLFDPSVLSNRLTQFSSEDKFSLTIKSWKYYILLLTYRAAASSQKISSTTSCWYTCHLSRYNASLCSSRYYLFKKFPIFPTLIISSYYSFIYLTIFHCRYCVPHSFINKI